MLTDYGKLHVASAGHAVLRPDSVDAAVQGWRSALAQGVALRVRGSGHGFSGATLPRAGETLVRTRGIDHYRVEEPGTITVGGGAVLWDVRDFVATCGWRMPVYHGGWAGPTVGGFVNTGGMGALRLPRNENLKPRTVGKAEALGLVSVSERYGGFWAHVARLSMIDGRGDVHDIAAADPDFHWIFASMGQFGLVLEVTLRLLPQPDAADALPVGRAGRIPVLNPVDPGETETLPPAAGIEWMYWFSAMAPVDEEDAAWGVIGDWSREHRDAFRPTDGWIGPVQDGAPIGYRYIVSRWAPTPPLLYPRDETFALMGVMGICNGIGTDRAAAALMQVARAFADRITARGWALYCQAENMARSIDFPGYLGPERWTRFCEMKDRYDPDDRINAGEMRPASCPPPMRTAPVRRVSAAVRRSLGL